LAAFVGAYGNKKRYDFFVQHVLDVKPADWNRVDKEKGKAEGH
jgi:hypothetical protein